jgi:hypothetical protein
MDGWGTSSPVQWHRHEQGWRDAMGETWVSSSLLHRAWKAMRFLPTYFRSRKEPVLQTYSGGNGQWNAGGNEAAWSIFNSGVGGVWRCSVSKVCSVGGGPGGRSSSKRWISARCLDKMDWWRRLARRWRLSWDKIRMGNTLFIGKNPTHSWPRRTPAESQPKLIQNHKESDQNKRGSKSSRRFITNTALG